MDYPFANLSSDVGQLARFKSDVVAWLKAATGLSSGQVFSAGARAAWRQGVWVRRHGAMVTRKLATCMQGGYCTTKSVYERVHDPRSSTTATLTWLQ